MPISSLVDKQLREYAKDDAAYQALRALFEQQQAKVTLQESETFHRAVTQQAPIAIYVYDIEKQQIVYGNPYFEQQLGYSLDHIQLMGRDLLDNIYHPDDVELRRETDRRLFRDRNGEIFVNIYRLIRADNETRRVEVYEMVLHRHPDGRPRQILGIGQDITQLQVAVDALAASREGMQRLIQQLPVGLQIFNTDGLCIDVNKIHLEIFGVTRKQIVGVYNIFEDPWTRSMPTRPAARRALQGETVSLGDLSFNFDESDPRFSGQTQGQKTLNVTIVPIFDKDNHVTSFVGVNVDVTERKRMENDLRESQRQYRNLANSITDAFLAMDHNLHYTFWNSAAGELLDISADEAIGKSFYELFPDLIGSDVDKTYQAVLQHQETRIFELTQEINGRIYHFEGTVYPSPSGGGINVLVRNVTERILAQQQAFELQLEKERGQLLAMFIEKATHEFRTPLSTIGTSVYLMTHTNDPEKMQQRAEQIESQIQRIARLVDMQLLMVKLDSGIPLSRKKINLNQICEILSTRKTREPYIQFKPQKNLPLIYGNSDTIETAIIQLLDNAQNHTPPNGDIILSTGTNNQYVWIAVDDTGCGIPEENHSNVFKAFWRQDVAHTSPGFGLGLPIAQKIVQAHNGHITLRSKVGEGSRFRIILPISPESIIVV